VSGSLKVTQHGHAAGPVTKTRSRDDKKRVLPCVWGVSWGKETVVHREEQLKVTLKLQQ